MKKTTRLAVSFHETFVPERIYLTELLKQANAFTGVTFQDISKLTGIPQGSSSGKVSAHIAYAKGMDLLSVQSEKGLHNIQLTTLGCCVAENDIYLSEQFSQILLHMRLCNNVGGAENWYQTFAKSNDVLGLKFKKRDLETYLESVLKKNPGTLGPLLNMYSEESSFGRCAAISSESDLLERKIMPFSSDYMKGYAVTFLQTWNDNFEGREQVTLTEFEDQTGWFAISGWSERQKHEALNEFAAMRLINVDRLLSSPVLTKLTEPELLMESMYNELA